MTRLASTSDGIARITDQNAELLDLPYRDLGAALGAGVTVGELAVSPVRKVVAVADLVLIATIPRPSKIWAIGFSYADHRTEVGYVEAAEDPVIFLKAPSSVIGTGGDVVLPPVAPNEVDYEGELAVVIGATAKAIDEKRAWDYVAGFTIGNDVSARDVQKGRVPNRAADVSAAKSFDTFTPLGPWLTTVDELADPDDLRLQTWVDGALRQNASTAQLIYPVSWLVAYLSRQTTLEPGDVIMTGTPAGVGHKQGKFLRPGARMRISIEGLGTLENRCVAADAASGEGVNP